MPNTPNLKTMREELEAHQLQPNELRLLAHALSCSESDAVFEDRLHSLAILGLIELADWIISRKRFNTITESDISRVLKIFLEIRQEVPTVEQLANDFGISEARGRHMLSRMNYGEARKINALFLARTAENLRSRLANIKLEKGRKKLPVDTQSLKCINDAIWMIVDKDEQGKYTDAVRPEIRNQKKQGAVVLATPKTWEYITNWLDEKAKEIEDNL